MQVSLSCPSLSILVPSSTDKLISMVQSQVAMSHCPKGASAARSWVTADALGEPLADGDEVPSPFLSCGSFGFTTRSHLQQVPNKMVQPYLFGFLSSRPHRRPGTSRKAVGTFPSPAAGSPSLPAASVQGRALASFLGSAALPLEPGWGDRGGERALGAPPQAWVNR